MRSGYEPSHAAAAVLPLGEEGKGDHLGQGARPAGFDPWSLTAGPRFPHFYRASRGSRPDPACNAGNDQARSERLRLFPASCRCAPRIPHRTKARAEHAAGFKAGRETSVGQRRGRGDARRRESSRSAAGRCQSACTFFAAAALVLRCRVERTARVVSEQRTTMQPSRFVSAQHFQECSPPTSVGMRPARGTSVTKPAATAIKGCRRSTYLVSAPRGCAATYRTVGSLGSTSAAPRKSGGTEELPTGGCERGAASASAATASASAARPACSASSLYRKNRGKNVPAPPRRSKIFHDSGVPCR